MGGACSRRRCGHRRLSDQELARCLLMVEARLAQHDATLDLHEAALSLMQGVAEEAASLDAQDQTPPPPPVEQRSTQTTELD